MSLDEAQVGELVHRFKTGETAVDLATELGVHRVMVLRPLPARGVETGHSKLTHDEVNQIVRRHQPGETGQQIAATSESAGTRSAGG